MNRIAEEIHLGRYLSKRLKPLAIGIGLLISIFFPATFYLLEYLNMSRTAEFDAARFAKAMHGLVMQSEPLWKYQPYEYLKIIEVLPLEKEANLRVFDDSGKKIDGYERINPKGTGWFDGWAPSASAPIRFNNRTVGSVEVSLSQGVLLARTFLILAISLCVGTALAALTYFFPVGIVTKMGKRLENLIISLQDAEAESRRLQSEAKLSEHRFRELVEGLDAVVWESNSVDWRFSYVSRQAEELLGYPLALWFSEPGFWQKHLYPEEMERIAGLYSTGFHAGSPFQVEHRILAADGRTVWIRNLIRVVGDDAIAGNRFRGIMVDITQQKMADESLAAEKERLAVTLRSIGDGVITTDTEGNVVLHNSAAEHLTGWKQEQVEGRPLHEVFSVVDDRSMTPRENLVETVVKTGSIVQFSENAMLIGRDGTERIIEASAAPICDSDGRIIGVVLAFRDMTEKTRMAQHIMKNQQLESLGVLAGGIAHDFNNLLTGIMGNVSLAMMCLEPKNKAFKKLQEVENIYERVKELIQNLLTFSKGSAPVKKTLSIGQLIKHATNFTLSGSNVRCNFTIPEDAWPVDVDEGQINRVITNLVINADQAMPDGGVIDIRLENETITETGLGQFNDGRYLLITIEDHGTGIPESHLPKIFDPYFTSKQRGNGLGLATVYSIIRNHDGHICVESKQGVGTTFYIYLPASENEPVARSVVKSGVVRGKGKVLVMDDEEIIRQVTLEMLDQLGYRVTVCSDGKEAIDLYRQAAEAGEPYDVVLVDLTIPGGMGGQQTMQKLQEINPEVKGIVSSGYSNDSIVAYYKEYGFSGFVLKPYLIEELSETMSTVLHAPNESANHPPHPEGVSQ